MEEDSGAAAATGEAAAALVVPRFMPRNSAEVSLDPAVPTGRRLVRRQAVGAEDPPGLLQPAAQPHRPEITAEALQELREALHNPGRNRAAPQAAIAKLCESLGR